MLLYFRVLSVLVLLLALVGCTNQKGTDYDYACRCTSEEETEFHGSCSTCTTGECISCLDWLCDDGFSDVDADPSNGCETACTVSGALNGECLSCKASTETDSAELTCTNMECIAGYFDVDSEPSNGCDECPTVVDATCTACEFLKEEAGEETECTAEDIENSACTLGCTKIECLDNRFDQDNNIQNGCETQCEVANATCEECFGTTCTSVTCDSTHLDLDGNASNGCEFACDSIELYNGTCIECSIDLLGCTGLECLGGYTDTDGQVANGCETASQTGG